MFSDDMFPSVILSIKLFWTESKHFINDMQYSSSVWTNIMMQILQFKVNVVEKERKKESQGILRSKKEEQNSLSNQLVTKMK